MKVLWIVNKIMPYPAEKLGLQKEVLGGWLDNLLSGLKKEKDLFLTVVSFYGGQTLFTCEEDKVKYYLIPRKNYQHYDKKSYIYFQKINKDVNPDIVHIHGSEYPIGIECNNVLKNPKTILSIQGLNTAIKDVYYGGMDLSDIIKNITLRDIIKRDGIIDSRRKYQKRSKREQELLHNINYIIGRTDWDRSNVLAINNKLKYYHLDEIIREEFYQHHWDISNMERHSITISQGYYPIKGLHNLIKAMAIVAKEYPDTKLYVTGFNVFNTKGIKCKLKLGGYGKYINKLIRNYHLENNIIFTGLLSEQETIKRMLKSNVIVVPSIVENESNSLTEAHILGVPTVAAFSGGMTNRIIHKKTGFLYPFNDYTMLANYIMEYLKDDNLCLEYAKNAYNIAMERNNKKRNIQKLIEIYNEVLSSDEE